MLYAESSALLEWLLGTARGASVQVALIESAPSPVTIRCAPKSASGKSLPARATLPSGVFNPAGAVPMIHPLLPLIPRCPQRRIDGRRRCDRLGRATGGDRRSRTPLPKAPPAPSPGPTSNQECSAQPPLRPRAASRRPAASHSRASMRAPARIRSPGYSTTRIPSLSPALTSASRRPCRPSSTGWSTARPSRTA